MTDQPVTDASVVPETPEPVVVHPDCTQLHYEMQGGEVVELTLVGGATSTKPALDPNSPEVLAYLKQRTIDQAAYAQKQWQSMLDSKLSSATSVAQSLTYAATLGKLSSDQQARLTAYNGYIKNLMQLAYVVPAPVIPDLPS